MKALKKGNPIVVKKLTYLRQGGIILTLFALAFFLLGCGKKGDPLTPNFMIPQKIICLTAEQE